MNKAQDPRYWELIGQYHYLSDLAKILGHTLRYIATHGGEWAALQGFSPLPGSALCVTDDPLQKK
jgi:hypothetical protein